GQPIRVENQAVPSLAPPFFTAHRPNQARVPSRLRALVFPRPCRPAALQFGMGSVPPEDDRMKLDFEHPGLLLLAILVPLSLFILRFSLVDSPRLQLALSAMTRCLILTLLVL